MNPNEKKIALNQLLRERFSDQDLRQICFDLQGVAYEDLSRNSRSDRILDLIIFLEKRGRLQEVVDWIVKNRQDIDVSMFQNIDWGSPRIGISQNTRKKSVGISSFLAFVLGSITFFVVFVGWYWFSPSLPSLFQPTNTPIPPTLTSTNTSVPPTLTSTNTPAPPTLTLTNTPVPPTLTLTNTPVPPTLTLTNTPIPPTPTSTFTPIPPTPTSTFVPPPPTSTPVDWRDPDEDGVLHDPDSGYYDLCQDSQGTQGDCGCPVDQVPSACRENNNSPTIP